MSDSFHLLVVILHFFTLYSWHQRHFLMKGSSLHSGSILDMVCTVSMVMTWAFKVKPAGYQKLPFPTYFLKVCETSCQKLKPCFRYLTWFPNVNESEVTDEIHEYMKDYEFHDSCIYQSVLRIWTSNGTMDTIFKLDQETIMKNITHAINGT